MFTPAKLRALELIHGAELANQLQDESQKDAADLNAQAVIRKEGDAGGDPAPAATKTDPEPAATKTDSEAATDSSGVVEVPQEFEAQVVQGFEMLNASMAALAESIKTLGARVEEVEKGLGEQQEKHGSSRASLSAWIRGNTKSATSEPDGAMNERDPMWDEKPKEAPAHNGHLLGGL